MNKIDIADENYSTCVSFYFLETCNNLGKVVQANVVLREKGDRGYFTHRNT